MEKLEQFKNIDPVIVNEVDELHCKLMPSAENIEGSGPKKMDNTLVIKFIEKLNLTKIFPPEYSANKIMVKDLNKEGLPRRSMNCFFVFRHVVYLEVLEQGLIEEVKDGVFFTQVVSEMWKKLGEEDREKYKKLATEVKNLQNEYHKDKIYCKNKPAGSIFVGMHDGNFRDTERKSKKSTTRKQPRKPKIIQKNTTNQVNQQLIYNIDNLDFERIIYPNYEFSDQNINYHHPLDNFFTCPQDINIYEISIPNETFNLQESIFSFLLD
ncbi:uncharacterized protein OCT59_010195 [Rhizophagus irregularis]|uniref:HMG box domain-containing protein n=2 Tax=Rhizophagus irregularis TaxID=588596 RepID=A0A915ZNI7_9GLOM|nr:hypothetical protein OCT59_010195 [Rhizophagus irregularis]GBC38684.1 hypothetical protein GLOIN_2v1701663 [Rhizophagus irregularis DAOM 181602=DAOM 197198]CAB4460734.1 unnamed protein product [Rhizophagus irregularis]CAB5164646.1 unnamed protein product [Rhizophagus irregularis]CAB5381962.1 unnamed protein product [Rhizophagus irregularis]